MSQPDANLVRHLQQRLQHPRPPIGPELVHLMGQWARYCRQHSPPNSTGSWHIHFLRWALMGRVKAFVEYAETLEGNIDAQDALRGIHWVYNKIWPHNSVGGYIFHYLYGWLQLELEKPGERPPPTIAEQRATIEASLAADGTKVKEWRILYGGLYAVHDDEENE